MRSSMLLLCPSMILLSCFVVLLCSSISLLNSSSFFYCIRICFCHVFLWFCLVLQWFHYVHLLPIILSTKNSLHLKSPMSPCISLVAAVCSWTSRPYQSCADWFRKLWSSDNWTIRDTDHKGTSINQRSSLIRCTHEDPSAKSPQEKIWSPTNFVRFVGAPKMINWVLWRSHAGPGLENVVLKSRFWGFLFLNQKKKKIHF